MSVFKKTLSVLLIAVVIVCSCLADTVLASGFLPDGSVSINSVQPDSDYDGIPDEYDSHPDNNTFSAQLKSGHEGTTAISFSMDYRCFFANNKAYDPVLAMTSVIGSALAYLVEDYGDAYIVFDEPQTWAGGTAEKVDGAELLRVLGFEDVVDYSLDNYGDDDICEVLLGHHTVEFNGETKVIVAVWVRGTDMKSEKEWSSNFNVGDLVRFFEAYDCAEGKSPRQSNADWTRKTNHRSYDVCATRLLNYLKTYYLDQYVQPALDAAPEASLAYWITGHSRGAAVAGIMAANLTDDGSVVYAYTFASPYNTANTEASAERYDCIFNLVNGNDFVPYMPMSEWGFTRYGKTAVVDASPYASLIKEVTGVTYAGSYLTQSDMDTLLNKFICITGENQDRNDPGKILGWREVYTYHCGHDHIDETSGDYQASTFCKKQSITNWNGPTQSGYNGYAIRLKKYSYWNDGICETPAYCMQVLVELMVKIAQGETLSGASTYLTSNKLADKFDFDKLSLVNYASKLTEPHLLDTYYVIQSQINLEPDPGSRFDTLGYYTVSGSAGGRPAHIHTYTYVPYEGHEPTCTEPGFGYRYCLCSQVNEDYYDDYQKNVEIPALGHAWGEVEYTWSDDHAECTARRTCAADASHIETETVAAAYEVLTEPTYSETGTGRYTAVFNNPEFDAQTIIVEIPMLDQPPVQVLLGDANVDGSVTFSDVSIIYMYLIGIEQLSSQGLINSDINGDGTVDFSDIAMLSVIMI